MEEKRTTKIVINGKEYHDLEEVPEQFRNLIQTALDEARADPSALQPGVKKVIKKTVTFSVRRPLDALKALADGGGLTGTASGSGGREKSEASPPPGAITPSSRGWIVWVILAVGLALYFLLKR